MKKGLCDHPVVPPRPCECLLAKQVIEQGTAEKLPDLGTFEKIADDRKKILRWFKGQEPVPLG